jgi:hypothetical protein
MTTPRSPNGNRETGFLTRRNLFIALALTVLVPSVATAVAAATSGKAQSLGLAGAEWFSDVAVKPSADPSSVAVATPAPIGIKRFVGVATTPLAATRGGPAFATLYVSAPVTTIGTDTGIGTEAGTTHVTTRLWMHGDAADSGPLYTTPMGVEVGWLDAAGPVHPIAGPASNGWTPVEIDGYLAEAATVSNLDSIWRTAESDYRLICAGCHVAHRPQDYSSMQWGIVVARMAKFAKLEPGDAMVILKWLQTTSAASDARR